ncbi:MAG: glycosyltransferase family protein [Propionibacteriaceae bacterium]
MTKPPVVLFAYARPAHTERTLQTLKENHGAADHDLVVHLDGPRTPQVADAVADVFRVVSRLADEGRFKSVTVHRSAQNRGLARSVIACVSAVLADHESASVLEDDLLLAPDFLTFMDDALAFYADDERIWSVSGYSPELPSLRHYPHDLYLSVRASSWGWGTWRRSWDLVDWAVEDYGRFEYDLRRRRAFNRGGRDAAAMLDAQLDGRIDSWAIRWGYSQHRYGMYSVVPAVTKVRNIGLDGSGTHGVVEGTLAQSLMDRPVTYEPLTPDPLVLRDFARRQRRYNKVPPYSFLRHLAAMWKTRPREPAGEGGDASYEPDQVVRP